MPTRPKTKLWGKIESIVASKTTRFASKKYQVKLVGVEKLIWVLDKELSTGVVAAHHSGNTLPKHAKARVDRGYVTKQKEFLLQQVHAQWCDIISFTAILFIV